MTAFLIVIAVLILFFLVVDYIDIHRFVKREYAIESDKINREICIVMLADLHNRQFGKNNEKLIEAVNKLSPDYICCAGDMIVARPGCSYEVAESLMKGINKYPVFYGIGNHEFRWKIYEDEYPEVYEKYNNMLRDSGITVLENDSVYIEKDNIVIRGIMIDREYYKRFERHDMSVGYVEDKCGTFSEDKFNILIAHNPEYFVAYAESGADLVLSGHVHGGIMRLPVVGGVISPRLGLFPRYTGGKYLYNDSVMVLSCGLGCHTLPLRIFNPGELSVIRLKPCSE